jgi:hypothetical protein
MLTQIQRGAMERAKAGDFRLLDAMEMLHPNRQRFRNLPLAGGINLGGRLQMFAYGGGRREIGTVVSDAQYITNLDGDLVYGMEVLRSAACPTLELSWTAASAAQVVNEYHRTVAEAAQAKQLPLLVGNEAVAA